LILVQWSCEIPLEEIECFIEFVKEKLKPFHESHGCKRLELFMPMELHKKYFPYQAVQKGNRYTEQLIFNDLKDFEKFLQAVEKDPRGKEITASYGREFNFSSCTFLILAQKV
jgi:hypothetical protein